MQYIGTIVTFEAPVQSLNRALDFKIGFVYN